MRNVRVVTWPEHHDKSWIRPGSFEFASKDNVVTLGLQEIAKVIMQLPVAFTRNNEDSYTPVVVMGLVPGKNLALNEQGQWLVEYIPAVYRCYPFRMVRNADGKFVLCVDHGSGLVGDDAARGFQFLADEKKPGEETAKIVEALMQLENERILIRQASDILKSHDVIEPWPLQIQSKQPIEGLHRINEAKFNTLPIEVLAELRECGGLVLAYGQLFSMQHIFKLGSLTQRKGLANKMQQGGETRALDIVEEAGILSFANL